ncbi:hypothetical protein CBS101457_004739 [Exobasidium rhododendri]|nr:hypothetical protein CBS101457_004739 [Exobasidium rhododendri]
MLRLSPRTPQFVAPAGQQYFELQTSRTMSPTPSSNALMSIGAGSLAPLQNIAYHLPPASPGAFGLIPDNSNSATNMQAHSIDRNDLHKGLKSLEGMLVTLDEYRDLKSKLAKCEKRLAKSLVELSKSKALEEVPSQTLLASSQIFDSITETTSKHAKMIQREYEALNEHCARYFKKVAKEEKAHDDQLDTLDSKVKKANTTHEKNAKKSGRVAIEYHDKYIQNVQALTQEISRTKLTHGSSIGRKTFLTNLVVASTLGGMADSEFKVLCENVRKSGTHIGKLNEWLNFASTEGMTNMKPFDLSDDAMGWAQVLAIKEAELRNEYKQQEKARLARLEQTHAVLKAQQMGWTPPTQQQSTSEPSSPPSPEMQKSFSEAIEPQKAVMTVNMPRLNSEGQVIEANMSGRSPSTPQPTSVAERPVMSRSVSAVSKLSQGDAPLGSPSYVPVSPMPLSKSKTNWGIQEEEEEEEGHQIHSPEETSFAGGSVIDHEENKIRAVKNSISVFIEDVHSSASSPVSPVKSSSGEDSEAAPSLTMSATNSKHSEDSLMNDDNKSNMASLRKRSFGPSTPTNEVPSQEVMIKGSQNDRVEGILKRAALVEDVRLKVERPLDRYVDAQPINSIPFGKDVLEKRQMAQQDEHAAERTRRLSLWEHEKERERQLERENELQRRLVEAEDRLRNMDREGIAVSKGYRREDIGSQASTSVTLRPRYSETSRNQPSTSKYEEEIPAQRYEPERYLPAVGTSRLSGVSVNRSLSTDSERSFVARMKAKYQADRDDRDDPRRAAASIPQKKQQQQQQRATTSPPRKVTDLALNYSSSASVKRSSDTSGGFTYEPIAPPGINASRPRYESAPGRPLLDNRGVPPSNAPHVAGCGCLSCSAHHYGGNGASVGSTYAKSSSTAHPPRHPVAASAAAATTVAPPNNRRQSMPLARDDRSTLAAPPLQNRELYTRRSFEEENRQMTED